MIHEVQHAVQDIEGFATGTTNGTARRIASLLEGEKSLDATWQKYSSKYGAEWAREQGFEPGDADKITRYQRILEEYNALVEKYRASYDLGTREMAEQLADMDIYMRWAGEVEARSAQARMGLSAEERRRRLLEDDEDVPRGEQIVLGENGGVSAAMDDSRPNVKFSLGDPAESFDRRREEALRRRGTVMPGLAEASVKVVDVPRHGYRGERILDQARNAAIDRYTEIVKDAGGRETRVPIVLHYNNHGQEFDYIISAKSIKESSSWKALQKTKDGGGNLGVHIAVLDRLDEVIADSIEFEEHPDMPHDENNNRVWDVDRVNADMLMHRFAAAVNIDGEMYRVKITFKEPRDENRPNKEYTYEVDTIEVLDGESSSTPNGSNTAASLRDGRYSVANLDKNPEIFTPAG